MIKFKEQFKIPNRFIMNKKVYNKKNKELM